MNTDEPQDLESALAAYRRLPRPQPPASLDAAIRVHARAAITRRAPAGRWPLRLATAATLVLAASLGWRAWQSGSDQPAPLSRDVVATEAAAPAAARTDAKQEPAEARQRQEQAPGAAPPLQDLARPAAGAMEAPPLPETAADIAQYARKADASAAQQAPESIAQPFDEAVATPAPPAAPPAPPAAAAPAPAEPGPVEGLAKQAQSAEFAAEAELDARSARSKVEAEAADPAAGGNVAGAAQPAPAFGGRLAAPATANDPQRGPADAGQEPGAALQPIRELLRQGRRAEARAALLRWQQDWPQEPVPEDLQALLR